MTAAVLVPVLSQIMGLAVLWRVRNNLGRLGYCLAAFPVGYLLWALTAALTTAVSRPYTVGMVFLGAALFLILTWPLLALLVPSAEGRGGAERLATPALSVLIVGATAAGVAWFGWAIAAGDSLGMEAIGIRLMDTGVLLAQNMSSRHPLGVSLHTAERLFGGDFAYISFVMFAVYVALFLAFIMGRDLEGLGRRRQLLITTVIVGLMVTNSVWLWNAIYIHTHMASAMFLLFAVGGIRLGVKGSGEGAEDLAWLFVAGLSTAGLVLMRPDAIAYAFVPAVVFAAARLELGLDRRAVGAFFAPLLVVLWVEYGLIVARIGIWAPTLSDTGLNNKPSGAIILMLLAVLTLFAGVLSMADRFPARVRTILGRPGRVRWIAFLASAAMIVAIALRRTDSMQLAFENAFQNLTLLGGWGLFWYVAAGLAVVSMLSALILPYSWRRMLVSLAILLFLACLAVIHSVGHPGRLGWGDSLNRVVFHVVPLIFWYAALLVGDLSDLAVGKATGEPCDSSRNPQ